MDKNYQKLIGKTKKEIIAELGFEFNHYPSDVWTYLVKSNWIGRKTVLFIHFRQGIAQKIAIRKLFGKYQNKK